MDARFDSLSPAPSERRKNNVPTPFFSIGVPTYDRRELLRQTLFSITGQSFSDFEAVVGNDYTQQKLSARSLGIQDQRIRFVNNRENLGELGNMNSLLGMSRGRYFTWQFDDDLYTPDFFRAVHDALLKFEFPLCVFTSYKTVHGTDFPERGDSLAGQPHLFTGRQFLRMVLRGRLKAMGCTGVFNAEYLKQIGGAERLCDGPIAIYSEYLLLMRCGLLEKVGYVDAPLILYRSHEGSRGYSNTDLDLWKRAGENLICRSIEVLQSPNLREDFPDNFLCVLKLTLHKLVWKTLAANGFVRAREVYAYLFSLRRYISSLRGSALYRPALTNLAKAGIWLIWVIALAKFKSIAPPRIVKLAMKTRSSLLTSKFLRS